MNAALAVFSVTVENTGERYRCAADRTLLQGMECLGRKGIPVGCRGGGCGVCRVQIIEGKVHAQHMSRAQVTEEDERNGMVLACKAKPLSDVRLRAIGIKAFAPRDTSIEFETSFKQAYTEGDEP